MTPLRQSKFRIQNSKLFGLCRAGATKSHSHGGLKLQTPPSLAPSECHLLYLRGGNNKVRDSNQNRQADFVE